MIRLAELFSYDYTVFVFGQEKYFENYTNENIHICKNLEEVINNSNKIISGVPLTRDTVTVDSPYSDKRIKLKELNFLLENKIFIAGGIPVEFYENKTMKNIDLLKIENLTILNAIPTVEGVIKIVIEETETTIHESNILITGYGRIGKILCDKLWGLGANIFCAAKEAENRAWIREKGYIPVKYDGIENYAEKIDIIINTVPSIVIEEKVLRKLKKDCIIIDIASLSGGVDKNIAKLYKIKVIRALGLPGKIAPKTSAKYIKEVIENIEEEIK